MGMLQKKENKGLTYYEVMHGNRKIAEINTRGEAVSLALADTYTEEVYFQARFVGCDKRADFQHV